MCFFKVKLIKETIRSLAVDFVIPQKGESLLGAYDKWRQWADEKGIILLFLLKTFNVVFL